MGGGRPFFNIDGDPHIPQLFQEVRYDRYSIKGTLMETKLDDIHITCDIHFCDHELLSGACQTSAKGHPEKVRIPVVE